jgi:taurine transport system permease protein
VPSPRHRLVQGLVYIAPFMLLLAVWSLVKGLGNLEDSTLPSIGDVITSSVQLIDWGVLPYNVSVSLSRLLLGALLAAVIGIPIGLMMGVSRYGVVTFGPFLRFFQSVSGIAILPLLIIWFGFSETTIQLGILYTALVPVIFNTMIGVQTIPAVYTDAVETLGGSRYRLVRDIYLPGSFSSIVVGLRLGVGYGWRALIVGEILVGKGGLGFMIFDARTFQQLGVILSGMILIGLLYLILDRLIFAALEDATVRRWGLERA